MAAFVSPIAGLQFSIAVAAEMKRAPWSVQLLKHPMAEVAQLSRYAARDRGADMSAAASQAMRRVYKFNQHASNMEHASDLIRQARREQLFIRRGPPVKVIPGCVKFTHAFVRHGQPTHHEHPYN
jgi:hypothetical protein